MLLVRAGTLPSIGFNPRESLRRWLDTVYPSLSSTSRPVEITQEQGQVLYLPEGWYHASVALPPPPSALSPLPSQGGAGARDFHALLSLCGECAGAPLHGLRGNSSGDDPALAAASSSSPLPRPPPHAHSYALSIRQQAPAPEIIRSEFYHAQRGRKLLQQGQHEDAIETLLRAVALGSGTDDAEEGAGSGRGAPAFSPQNDPSLVALLGTAYAAVSDAGRAERAFLFSVSLNR